MPTTTESKQGMTPSSIFWTIGASTPGKARRLSMATTSADKLALSAARALCSTSARCFCERGLTLTCSSRSRRSTHRSKPTPTPRSSQVPATEEGHSRLCSSKRLCRRRRAICSFAAQQNDCTSRLPLRNLSESELQLTHLIRVEASAHARVFLVGSRLLNVPQARIPVHRRRQDELQGDSQDLQADYEGARHQALKSFPHRLWDRQLKFRLLWQGDTDATV